MIRTPLSACPVCTRHVRVNEHACPFCRAELPSWFRDVTTQSLPRARLSRAALYALRMGALSATAAACGSGQYSGAFGKPLDGSVERGLDGSEEEDAPFLMAVAYGLAVSFQLCDSAASCPPGDTCGPLATDPSLPMTVCNGCASSAGCQPGQVCCSDQFSTTACQAGPCPDVPGEGPIQLCAISAECFTAGDTCGPPNDHQSEPNLLVCNPPGAGGITDDGGSIDGSSSSDGGAGGDAGDARAE
ncbi:MAG: hypothetical protein ACLP1X_33030 [Polyangiaceae bacterium]